MSAPYYSDDSFTLLAGDCRNVLPTLAAASVDAVVCDPPYALSFMGKAWDTAGVAFDPATWREVARVLKPGGHLLAFGGTRTYHRLACAIEDAGFEIRDSISWLYGSGFPKSLDVSKAMDRAAGAEREVVGTGRRSQNRSEGWDRPWMREQMEAVGGSGMAEHDITAPATDAAKQWQGWGTALKPAHEPIVVARKSTVGTVAGNVAEHGTGALNIDACRIAGEWSGGSTRSSSGGGGLLEQRANSFNRIDAPTEQNPAGRWPTNVVLDESQASALDAQTGVLTSGGGDRSGKGGIRYDRPWTESAERIHEASSGGASRFFPTFRYEAKAPATERTNVNGVLHPTVKPLDLMRWLVRLVTPPGGLVLDPFLGSGTTAEACILENLHCIGIEREPDYLPLIVQRISKPLAVGLDFGVTA